MPPSKQIKYWLTTTSSSASSADIATEQPVDRPTGRRLVVRAFAAAMVVVVLFAGCGDSSDNADKADSGASADTVVGASSAGDYDLQGHRGARGLRPENTLPSFEVALDLMVNTLEFDLHLSADDRVIVWHDPLIDSDKCTTNSPNRRVRKMTAAELSQLRCAQNPDTGRFADQQAEPGAVSNDGYAIVSLAEVFDFVVAYAASPSKSDAQRANAASVRFNIETKRKVDDPAAIGDGFDGQSVGVFEAAIIDDIDAAGVRDRVTVQSFDHRSLWAIHADHSDISLAALTRRNDIPDFVDLADNGATIWSPDYRSVNASSLAAAHSAGLLVVPWTINDADDMVDLLALGVDGIITDRPDLAPFRS